METAAIMNLLTILLPLGVKVYDSIQQANADQYKPLADILAAADTNWDSVIAAAQAEIAKTPTA
jgi:hypothetical protein